MPPCREYLLTGMCKQGENHSSHGEWGQLGTILLFKGLYPDVKTFSHGKAKSFLRVLRRCASGHGIIKQPHESIDGAIAFNKGSYLKGCVYIQFRNPDGAAEAAERLNNQPFHTTKTQMLVEHTKMANLDAGRCGKYEKCGKNNPEARKLDGCTKTCQRLHLEKLDK